ncbi:FUSC family protein [Mesorhizobium sp. 43Arga]
MSDPLSADRASLLFAIRLWMSVCLALLVALWLQLDNPYWAGASASVVCQPQLGASLRKGWFRMIGTIAGAVVIVVLTACFAQDRIAYLGMLALWAGLCAFAATAFKNFASYGAALAGYTAGIIAANNLGATGGASPDVFLLAVWRVTEICVGIACAGLVLAGTDFGGARRRLAALFADLTTEIAAGFSNMLERAGSGAPDRQLARREILRRVIALDPIVDQTLGESSHVRLHAAVVEAAVRGLLRAIDGWRTAAAHLSRLPDQASGKAQALLRCIPAELRSASEPRVPRSSLNDPTTLSCAYERAAQALFAIPADTPSWRLLADETAKVLTGMADALDGVALLVDAPNRSLRPHSSFRPGVADWLPATINGARACLAVGAVTLFWIATAWPNGAAAIFLVMIVLLLLGPRGDGAYGGAIAFVLGIAVAIVCTAITKFALLPAFQSFPALCAVLGVFILPLGFALARSKQPAAKAIFTTASLAYVPLLAPTNEMSYNTAEFYNSALSAIVGAGIGALAFALLPPLPPTVRARRLLALTLRDLRRVAAGGWLPTFEDWERRIFARLAALPDQADPLQRAQLLAALSVGTEIIWLRHFCVNLGTAAEQLQHAFGALALGDSSAAIGQLRLIDGLLASAEPRARAESSLHARGGLLLMCEALSEHAAYFDEEKADAFG